MSNDKITQAIQLLLDVNAGKGYGDMQKVFARIERCWDRDTGYFDLSELSEQEDIDSVLDSVRSGFYQCATTTKLLHEIYGGDVMMGEVDGRRHYWNKINDVDVDITRRQFDTGAVIKNVQYWDAGKLVENEWMEERMQTLRDRYYLEEKKEALYGEPI